MAKVTPRLGSVITYESSRALHLLTFLSARRLASRYGNSLRVVELRVLLGGLGDAARGGNASGKGDNGEHDRGPHAGQAVSAFRDQPRRGDVLVNWRLANAESQTRSICLSAPQKPYVKYLISPLSAALGLGLKLLAIRIDGATSMLPWVKLRRSSTRCPIPT